MRHCVTTSNGIVTTTRVLEPWEAYQLQIATDELCSKIANVTEFLLHNDIEGVRNILQSHKPDDRKAILTSDKLKYPAIYYARTNEAMECVLQCLDEQDRLDALHASSDFVERVPRSYQKHFGLAISQYSAIINPGANTYMSAERRLSLLLTMLDNLNAEQRLKLIAIDPFFSNRSWLKYASFFFLGDSSYSPVNPDILKRITDRLDTDHKMQLLTSGIDSKTPELGNISPLVETLTLKPPHHKLFNCLINSIPENLRNTQLFIKKFEYCARPANSDSIWVQTTLLHLAIDYLDYDEDSKLYIIAEHEYKKANMQMSTIGVTQFIEKRSTPNFCQTSCVPFNDTPLFCIIKSSTPEQIESMLIVCDGYGKTPLHYIHHANIFAQFIRGLGLESESWQKVLFIEDKYGQPVISTLFENPGFAKISPDIFASFSSEEKACMLLKQGETSVTVLDSVLENADTLKVVVEGFLSDHEWQAVLKTPLYPYGQNILHNVISEIEEYVTDTRGYTTSLEDSVFVELHERGPALTYKVQKKRWQDTKVFYLLNSMGMAHRIGMLATKDCNGRSALHLAKSMAVLVLILKMIDEPQRAHMLSLRDGEGFTPLHLFRTEVYEGPRICTVLSLEREEEKTDRGNLRVPELIACIGQDKFIELLNKQENSGCTPLHLLVYRKDAFHLTKQVLDCTHDRQQLQAILQVKTWQGITVMHAAVHGISKNIDDHHYRTENESMINEDKMKTVIHLLEGVSTHNRVAALTTADCAGDSVMHKLAYHMEELILKLVKMIPVQDRPKVLMVKRSDGSTPTHLMTRNQRYLSVLRHLTELIQESDRINMFKEQDCSGLAPIHLAAESPMILKHVLSQLPSKKVCCKLLQTKNANGMTALHKALAVECMESIHYMVEFCGIDSLLGILAPRASLEDFHKAMAVIAMEGATPLKDWLQRIGLIQNDVIQMILCWSPLNISRDLVDDMKLQAHQQIGEKVSSLHHSRTHHLKEDIELLAAERYQYGDTIVHLLVRLGEKVALSNVLAAMNAELRHDTLSLKNYSEKTPRQLAQSFEIAELLKWSVQQSGFYYLQSPPVVILMHSTEVEGNEDCNLFKLDASFTKYKLRIFQYKNPTKQLTFDAIRRAQEDSDVSALVVCVIGHGGQGAVEATDGSVRIQDILDTMCSPILDGKPKVLMIQACQARGSASITGLHLSLELKASQLASLHYRDTLTMVASVGASMDNDNSMMSTFSDKLQQSEDGDIYQACLDTLGHARKEVPDQMPELYSTLAERLCLSNVYPYG